LEVHGNPAFNTHPVSFAATPLFRGEGWKSPLKRGDLGGVFIILKPNAFNYIKGKEPLRSTGNIPLV